MDKGSERPRTPRNAMRRALIALQSENFKMLQVNSPNEGRGNSIERMAEILDEESGYSELYEALEGVLHLVSAVSREEVAALNAARAALAKANPKEEKQNG